MSKKLAAIFAYLGPVFWLISLLAYPDKKDNSKNLSSDLSLQSEILFSL